MEFFLMGEVRSFLDLRTWKESHALTLEIYRLTKAFPGDERYGLVSQLRRSASSIPSNIAEGMGRGSAADLGRFLINARGSLQETVYHLILAKDLGYCQDGTVTILTNRYNGLNAGINAHLDQIQKYK